MHSRTLFNNVLAIAFVVCASLHASVGLAVMAGNPVVTRISPSTGPLAGGTTVTITGSNFVVGAATIKFGANAGTSATCATANQCTATSPAGSGTVSVRVSRLRDERRHRR